MGYGDDIMATGDAKTARAEHPNAKVVFADPDNPFHNEKGKARLHWSIVYENNPNILQPGEDAEDLLVIPIFPGSRPYINYEKSRYATLGDSSDKIPIKIAYNRDFQAPRGELYFTADEIAKAEEAVAGLKPPIAVIEPLTKGANNKAWIWERWQEVVEQSDCTFVQLGADDDIPWLDGVQKIVTPSFREACAILAVCKNTGFFLGTDGGLHHAAAAIGLPAIVLWSHYSHPDNLGYEDHVNIRWDAAGSPCGLREPCIQCQRSMEMIKVNDVLVAIGIVKGNNLKGSARQTSA
ncbi:MAG: hypothetical protein WD407_02290 [Rhodospirillales bacterium]